MLFLVAAPAQADPVFPLGSRIGLEPPPSMTLNKTSNLFEDADRNSSITVLDLPLQLYGDMERMVFAQANQPGVTVIKRESFPYASGIGYFIAAELTVDGVKYRKWLLLASSASNPSPDLAALVSIQVPATAFDVYTDEVARKALATVTFRPAPLQERLGLLPFVIGDTAGFEVVEVAPTGVVLSEKPERGGQPEVVVSIGKDAPAQVADRPNFARQIFERGPVRDMEITSAEPMRIGGMAGFEIKARAKTPAGAPILLVQWMRFGGSGYLRVVAGANAEEWEQAYPRFRAVRDGVSSR